MHALTIVLMLCWPNGYCERAEGVVFHSEQECADFRDVLVERFKAPTPDMLWGFAEGGEMPKWFICAAGPGV